MRKWEKGILAIGNVHKGVDYATRMNLYNLIFEMVILDVTVSASATQAPIIITVSRASPSRARLGLRPRGALRARDSLYEFVCTNLYYLICIKNVRIVRIGNTICITVYELYEFVCMNLYNN